MLKSLGFDALLRLNKLFGEMGNSQMKNSNYDFDDVAIVAFTFILGLSIVCVTIYKCIELCL